MDQSHWETYLASYHAERPGITEQAFEHARHPRHGTPHDWLAAAMPANPGVVLDAGCGNAPLHDRLPRGGRYLGVDASDAELQLANRRSRGPVLRGDLRDLPLPDSSVDTVVSSMSLMLVHPVHQVMAELARVLRPGGAMLLLLPSMWPLTLADAPPLLSVSLSLRGPGSMPQRVTGRRVRRTLTAAGLLLTSSSTCRFPFAIRSKEDADLAVEALYTPGRSQRQRDRTSRALAAKAPDLELPLPLRRVVAIKARPRSAQITNHGVAHGTRAS